jgi:hypothetical protein
MQKLQVLSWTDMVVGTTKHPTKYCIHNTPGTILVTPLAKRNYEHGSNYVEEIHTSKEFK